MNSEKNIALSVIIVNYNVAFFLEQCLNSIFQSKGIEALEVIVVDNRSSDNSVAMVSQKFPQVKLLTNDRNLGFSKANNQGIKIANGEFIVLLNPDTVVEEQTFEKILKTFKDDPQIGGVGVKMVDGKGQFLPESKRGLPTPWVAFYKVFGLSALFPRSKQFGKYHLSYLSPDENHDVDILSGAFMGLRKSILNQIGLLDETFFMYGEDIDLSYRITKAGYKNRYLADTAIIHYKGESTKKSSVNYVFVFYKAMIIFARKHFSQNHAFFFSGLVYLGILVRACLALMRRFVTFYLPPLVSNAISLAGLYALTYPWQMNEIAFPKSAYYWMIPWYWTLWASSNLLGGTYDPPFKTLKVFKSTFYATFVILVVYALLPKTLQFSRLYILFGALWFALWVLFDRLIHYFILRRSNGWNLRRKTRFLIVADAHEFSRIKSMVLEQVTEVEYLHGAYVSSPYVESKADGNVLHETLNFEDYDEIIFSAKDLTAKTIIHWMTTIVQPNMDFKIAQPESDFIIGSNSLEKQGEFYKMNINNLSRPENLRSKRFLDIITCLMLLISSWAIIWFFRNKRKLIANFLEVLQSRKTWVGFFPTAGQYIDPLLPRIKTGVLHPNMNESISSEELKEKLNLIYARDYSLVQDIKIITASFFLLDGSIKVQK